MPSSEDVKACGHLGFYRSKFDREAVWRGRLSHLLLQERSDLQLVLRPLQTLRNVVKPSIVLPPLLSIR